MFSVSSWLIAIAMIFVDAICFVLYLIGKSEMGQDDSMNWIKSYFDYGLATNALIAIGWLISGQYSSVILFIIGLAGYLAVLGLKFMKKAA